MPFNGKSACAILYNKYIPVFPCERNLAAIDPMIMIAKTSGLEICFKIANSLINFGNFIFQVIDF